MSQVLTHRRLPDPGDCGHDGRVRRRLGRHGRDRGPQPGRDRPLPGLPGGPAALISGRLVQLAIVSLIQSLIVILLGLLVGAHFPGGVTGLAVLVGCSALLGASLGALSNGMALLARKEETVIAASNFVLLPLTFLSSAFMQRDLVPGWIQTVARYNPVEWTVQAGREALGAQPGWGLVLSRAGLLATPCVACTWLATRAFRTYQRSI
jgi:ABC-2 type transport system permease protein